MSQRAGMKQRPHPANTTILLYVCANRDFYWQVTSMGDKAAVALLIDSTYKTDYQKINQTPAYGEMQREPNPEEDTSDQRQESAQCAGHSFINGN